MEIPSLGGGLSRLNSTAMCTRKRHECQPSIWRTPPTARPGDRRNPLGLIAQCTLCMIQYLSEFQPRFVKSELFISTVATLRLQPVMVHGYDDDDDYYVDDFKNRFLYAHLIQNTFKMIPKEYSHYYIL